MCGGRTENLGLPDASVVPPGQCYFGEKWDQVKLRSKRQMTHDTIFFEFELPADKSLGLSTCSCLLAKVAELKPRPYTPVSTNSLKGAFQLVIKIYPEGAMSTHFAGLKVGESMKFMHIPFNNKIQFETFSKKQKIGMIVGGTGITPMIQALHAILGTTDNTTEVSMIFGNRTQNDILLQNTIDDWAAKHDRFKVVHVLNQEPEGSSWTGARGLPGDFVKEWMPAPSSDCLIFVCGPHLMYTHLCGERGAGDHPTDENYSGILKEAGYSKAQVYKF